jgi:O-acetyl-ADP-ribose deacetylase (regulator of RNase III)
MFGYEDPREAVSNARSGTDFESSTGVLIDAPDVEDALRWGREVSQAFVTWLFERENEPAPDWRAGNFAHWLEPDASEAWAALANAPVVKVGQMPSFERLLPSPHQGQPTARLSVVQGDLLDQDVDVIVNAWNRNVIPWWLLVPQGVSRAIRRRAGNAPFWELGRMGPIPLGGAVLTSAGRLPHKAIIHVAGIDLLWRSSEHSVRQCVRNALALARERGFRSIALPLIGAGTGGRRSDLVQAWIVEESQMAGFDGEVRVVRYSAS